MSEHWILEALRLTAGDASEDIHWSATIDGVRIFAGCNDFFMWGCADSEEITEATLPTLASARADIEATKPKDLEWLGCLYAARVRMMRPQGVQYKYIPEELHPLFDACGPHRKASLGNPVATPKAAARKAGGGND